MKAASQSVARYEHLRRVLERKILSGQWLPGSRVPSEHSLVAQFGYSRMTVHRALRELTTAGLIVRAQGKISQVASPTSHTTIVEVPEVRVDIVAQGAEASHVVEERGLLPEDSEERAHFVPSQTGSVLALSIIHLASGQPYVLERRLISVDAVPASQTESYAETPPDTWLLKQVPWSDAEHRFRATLADEATAKRLAIPVGAACLVVERRTFFVDRPITWVRFTYPGDRHDLTGRFTYLKPQASAG